MAARAELRATASLDGKQFEVGMRKIKGEVGGFASQLGGLKSMIAGAFTVGAVVSFGRKMLQTADDLQTAATSVGITMEAMLGLQSAMAASGIKAESMLKILGKLKSTQGEVVNGVKTYTDAIKDLNISEEEFVGLNVDRVLELLAKQYAEAGGSAEAFNAINKIFGERIGKDLIEVFGRLNKEGLDAFTEKSKAAASGMRDLAAASDSIEEAQNYLTRATGATVGWFMKRGEKIADFRSEWQVYHKALAEGKGSRHARVELNKFRALMAKVDAGAKPEKAADTSADVEALKTRKEAEAAAAKEKADKEAAAAADKAAAEAKSAALKKEEEQVKRILEIDKARVKYAEQQEEVIAGHKEAEGAIEERSGAIPQMFRVDAMQRIGGMVGGASGMEQQWARIQERQASLQKELNDLMRQTNSKLDELHTTFKAAIE